MRNNLPFTLVFIIAGVIAFAGETPEKVRLEPDTSVQSTFKRLSEFSTGTDWTKAVNELKKVPREKMIRQLLLFSVKAEGMKEAMLPGVLLEHLELPIEQIPYALIDYLDTMSAEELKVAKDYLQMVEHEKLSPGGRFANYQQLISHRRRTGQPEPVALFRHMYQVDRREAFFAMMRVEKWQATEVKPLVWAEHVVAEVDWRKEKHFPLDDSTLQAASAELKKMAESKYWWSRLYAVHALRDLPELRTEQLIEVLANDKDALVKEAGASLAK